MTVKQRIGVAFIATILAATVLSILGIWGLIGGDTVWRLLATLGACAGGLGVAGAMLDRFFK